MTPDDFRRLALEMPGAIESAHMNHPDFRLRGKIFATLGVPDEGWGTVMLTPIQQRTFLREAPGAFRPCSGAWGRQGSTHVQLGSVSLALARAALEAARENIEAKGKKKAPHQTKRAR